MKTEVIQKLSATSLFKILFIGNVITFLMLILVCMVLVVLGVLPMGSGVEEVPLSFSISALGIYLGVGALLSPLWVLSLWLSTIPGLWLWSKIKPISLTYTLAPDE